MTKKELLEAIKDCPDDTEIKIRDGATALLSKVDDVEVHKAYIEIESCEDYE